MYADGELFWLDCSSYCTAYIKSFTKVFFLIAKYIDKCKLKGGVLT